MTSDDSPRPRFDVLGVKVHALTLQEACTLVLRSKGRKGLGYCCFCTAHGIVESLDNHGLRDIYNLAALAAPDGMPLVWLGRHKGFKSIDRVYGPDLLLATCHQGRAVGLRHYFYGGAPGVAADLVRRLEDMFPGLEVCGYRTPPYGSLEGEEFVALQADVARVSPDLIWVGLGAPKQEHFMVEQGMKLDVGLLLGVGAAFDFHSGRVRQAPPWVQRCGLEWLFRFAQEPRRLWRRYLFTTPRFAFCVLRQLWRER